MNTPRSSHFGNPLITTTVGSKSSLGLHTKAPVSPGSTFSNNDIIHIKSGGQHHQQPPQIPRGTMPLSPSSYQQRHTTVSPNTSFTEREPLSTSSQGDSSFAQQQQRAPNETSVLVGSTITTGSTIGLPSHYPGSATHDRMNSLESSVLLEELQDFDDIFGRVPPLNHNNNNEDENNYHGRESSVSKIQGDYDDDDDLHALSRSLPFRLNLEHRRNVSELSASSLNIPPSVSLSPPTAAVPEQSRSSASANSLCSNGSNLRSSIRSSSTARSHRRSRNLAMGSSEFQNAVLEEL